MLKLIGYWMRDLREEQLPLPHELVGGLPGAVVDALCGYLGAGEVFEVYRGHSWCRFHCGIRPEQMGSREFTDGEWVWPEGLAHYVRLHKVCLPEEFIGCATSARKSLKPWKSPAEGGEIPSIDFWIGWAKARRSEQIRKCLKSLLDKALSLQPAQIEVLVNEVIKREGEGSDVCTFAGCMRHALKGRKICARHTLTDEELGWRTGHLFAIPHKFLS